MDVEPASSFTALEGKAFSNRVGREQSVNEQSTNLRALCPLVSVIITNYNYAAFLEQAVESVMSQTYPNIECVIVDDCSTDASPSVIATLKSRHPTIRTFVNPTNSGQSASCVHGFEKTSGAYVIFLDADDYLLPSCIETHIRAHLSLRLSVGFTSLDMILLVDEHMTRAGLQDVAQYVRSGVGVRPDIFRKFEWDDEPEVYRPALENLLHYVAPKDSGKWPWSATSANCFRRDALKLILDNKKFRELKINTDTYVFRGINALCGSVIIDLPLVVYRIHGNNYFIWRASLNRFRGFKAAPWRKNSQIAMSAIIDHIVDSLPELSVQMDSHDFIVDALLGLSDTYPKVEASRFNLNYLTEVLLKRRQLVFDTIGKRLFYRLFLFSLVSKPQNWAGLLLYVLVGAVLLPVMPLIFWAVDRGLIFPLKNESTLASQAKTISSATSVPK